MSDEQNTTETPEKKRNPIEIPPEAGNLVEYLRAEGEKDDEVLKFIVTELPDQIANEFSEDWDSRDSWMKKQKDRVKLYVGDIDPPQAPFENVASMHQPILLERILRIAFRIHAELFKDREPIWRAIPSSAKDKERAEILTLVDNWHFTKEIPDFPAEIMRAIILYLRDGDCVMDSYFDEEEGKNRHEALSPSDVVFPYTWKSTRVDMSDVPRKTKILRKYKRDIQNLEAMGEWSNTTAIHRKEDGTFDDQIDNPIRELMDKYEGRDKTDVKSDAPYTFLDYRGWCLFPGHEVEMPIRAIMHYQTKTIVSLMLRQYDDPEDKIRYERQTAEFKAYMADFQTFQEIQKKESDLLVAISQPGVDPQEQLQVAQAVQNQTPPQPIAPQWLEFDEAGAPMPPLPCKQRPIELMSHGTCIENPDGSLGLGIGLLLMPFQEAANILLNQFVQAAVHN